MIKELPEFPWAALAPLRKRAAGHPDGIVNLALGTPVDPTPDLVQAALRAASDAPGHPATEGTPQFRAAATGYLRRRLGIEADEVAVLPTIGTKEVIAWLPTLLGIGAGDPVAFPALSFPTYDMSARLAGAVPTPVDLDQGLPPRTTRLLWLNSPGNPDGRVLSTEQLRQIVWWGRQHKILVVNDECYIEHGWDAHPRSILDPQVCGGSHAGVLAVHSMSKRSNLAGYRAGFIAGDPDVVQQLLEVRRHGGMIPSTPTVAAMTAALGDDAHIDEQRERYRRRRAALTTALRARGLRVDHSEAGLFLWVTEDRTCWETAESLAELGILVAPGTIYGPSGARHVRLALTATDERVEAAVARLTSA